jgi:hypothetical protein
MSYADLTKDDFIGAISTRKLMRGEIADAIIVALIDHCDDVAAAQELGISKTDWSTLVQKFEEDIRYRVRDIRN